MVSAGAKMAGSSLALGPVEELSDDDGYLASKPTFPTSVADPGSKRPARRLPAKKRSKEKFTKHRMDARSLRYRLARKCGCQGNCFLPFTKDRVFDRLQDIHKTLSQMDKIEQDKYVKSSIKSSKICQNMSKPSSQVITSVLVYLLPPPVFRGMHASQGVQPSAWARRSGEGMPTPEATEPPYLQPWFLHIIGVGQRAIQDIESRREGWRCRGSFGWKIPTKRTAAAGP